MKKLLCCSLSTFTLCAFAAGVVQAQVNTEPILLATEGGVEAWSMPQEVGREDVVATKIVLRGVGEDARLVTYTDIEIAGHVRQLHSSLVPGGNALGRPDTGALFGDGWADVDTHLLINEAMIAGGVFMVGETNDGSLTPSEFEPLATTAEAVEGYGPLKTSSTTDAFFLQPEFQNREVDFAYIVSDMSQGMPAVELTVGVLGAGIIDAGTDGGAYFQNVPVMFQVPEPATHLIALVALLGIVASRRHRRF